MSNALVPILADYRRKVVGVAVIDPDMLPLIVAYGPWHLHSEGYPSATDGKGKMPMHQLVAGHRWVDHRDGDKLNCRRENLRPTTPGQNQQNRRGANRDSKTGVRGVSWHKGNGKWQAQVAVAGKNHYLGYFDTIAEAEAVAIAFRRKHMPYSEADRP